MVAGAGFGLLKRVAVGGEREEIVAVLIEDGFFESDADIVAVVIENAAGFFGEEGEAVLRKINVLARVGLEEGESAAVRAKETRPRGSMSWSWSWRLSEK